jgi:hypothetical protein
MPDSCTLPRSAADADPAGSRSARLHDRIHLLGLAMKFPGLADPSTSPYLVSFRYTDIADAEVAAGAVRTAEGILSRQLGVTFEGNYPHPIGSAAHYQRTAELRSGLFVIITARSEVGPLIEAEDAPRELAEVA